MDKKLGGYPLQGVNETLWLEVQAGGVGWTIGELGGASALPLDVHTNPGGVLATPSPYLLQPATLTMAP